MSLTASQEGTEAEELAARFLDNKKISFNVEGMESAVWNEYC